MLAMTIVRFAVAGESRMWTSQAGSTVEAEYVKQSFGTVYLRRADGTELAIPLNALSPADQQYVKSRVSSSRAAPGPPDPSGSWVGYGGPMGTRVYPDAKPAKEFDMTTGKGVDWIAPLPGWGHGQPVAVAGRVFVIVEPRPKQIFPTLLCYNQKDGRLLWERPLDHLKEANAENAREDLEAWFERQTTLLKQQYGQRKPEPDGEHHARMRELNDKMGFQYDAWKLMSPHTGWCFTLECFGEGFGAPVSDGNTVWANTTWGGYFAFDMNGRALWTAYAPKERIHSGNMSGTQRGRSMILHEGLLISDVLNVLRVFDAKTGKLRWSRDFDTDKKGKWAYSDVDESMATPTVLTVNGKDILITGGRVAFLLPDDKQLEVEGWNIAGMQLYTHPTERDVLLSCGAGEHCGWPGKGYDEPPNPPACWRFSLSGDKLKAKLLWHGGNLPESAGRDRFGGNKPWLMIHDNRLYHSDGVILDSLTGKILDGSLERHKGIVPETRHFLNWADGRVYGMNAYAMYVYTDDGKFVSKNPLARPEFTPEQKEVLAWTCGSDKAEQDWMKNNFSYSHTFAFDGDRMFLRSFFHLVAIK